MKIHIFTQAGVLKRCYLSSKYLKTIKITDLPKTPDITLWVDCCQSLCQNSWQNLRKLSWWLKLIIQFKPLIEDSVDVISCFLLLDFPFSHYSKLLWKKLSFGYCYQLICPKVITLSGVHHMTFILFILMAFHLKPITVGFRKKQTTASKIITKPSPPTI